MGRNEARETLFRFKQFSVANTASAMKVGTDGILLGAWAYNETPKNILDIGTGTGVIALMMAQRFPYANITAIEIDPIAAEEASANFEKSPWRNRLSIINADFKKWANKTDMRFDCIVSNPPFFTNGIRSANTNRATARHSDTLGPADIINRTPSILSNTGKLAIIVPNDMTDNIIYESAIARLYPIRQCEVISAPGKTPFRTLWEFSTTDSSTRKSTLLIRDNNGFSNEYRELTSDFYLQF